MRQILLAGLCLFAMLPVTAAEAPQPPNEFIQTVVDDILNRLEGRREMLANDSLALHALVDEVLNPVFDFRYAARLVLGIHARRATPEQLARFEKAFYDYLVITYAEGLVKFTSDRVKVLPFRGRMDPRRTMAKTEVYRNDGTPVPVDYALHWSKSGWKIYDVVIEGISYVTNYRTDMNTQVSQEGLEAVIERYENQVAEKRTVSTDQGDRESSEEAEANSG